MVERTWPSCASCYSSSQLSFLLAVCTYAPSYYLLGYLCLFQWSYFYTETYQTRIKCVTISIVKCSRGGKWGSAFVQISCYTSYKTYLKKWQSVYNVFVCVCVCIVIRQIDRTFKWCNKSVTKNYVHRNVVCLSSLLFFQHL